MSGRAFEPQAIGASDGRPFRRSNTEEKNGPPDLSSLARRAAEEALATEGPTNRWRPRLRMARPFHCKNDWLRRELSVNDRK